MGYSSYRFKWYPDDDHLEEGQHDIFLVVLQEGLAVMGFWDDIPINSICGLVLTSTKEASNRFERAGMFAAGYDDAQPPRHFGGKIALKCKAAEERILTII